MSVAPERTVCRTCGRMFSEGERFCPYDRTELGPERRAGADPLLGTVVSGSYTLIERLGIGGMGVVYKARQNRLERNVAVKVLSQRLGVDRGAEDRFRTEALAVSQLSNPHTVAIHDFGSTEDGLLYLVMQLLEGESLRARLERGPLDIRSALSISAQICESLTEAHDRVPQIVHRDIKPDNVMVRHTSSGEDFATVLDFGLAKLADSEKMTASGFIVGTPAYMAPEQAQADRLDGRVNLYAVGAMLHEMLAGRPPFSAANATAVLYKQVWDPPPKLTQLVPDAGIPIEVERIVLQLLAKKPEDRPPSAAAVRARLLEILRTLPESASTLVAPALTPPARQTTPPAQPSRHLQTRPDLNAAQATEPPPAEAIPIAMELTPPPMRRIPPLAIAGGAVLAVTIAVAVALWFPRRGASVQVQAPVAAAPSAVPVAVAGTPPPIAVVPAPALPPLPVVPTLVPENPLKNTEPAAAVAPVPSAPVAPPAELPPPRTKHTPHKKRPSKTAPPDDFPMIE